MLFIRLCFDKPDVGAIREEHRAAHRAYLASGIVKLIQAGPLMDDANKKNIASFMVVEADDLEQVKRFHDGDLGSSQTEHTAEQVTPASPNSPLVATTVTGVDALERTSLNSSAVSALGRLPSSCPIVRAACILKLPSLLSC